MHDPIENLNFIYGLGFRSSQLANARRNKVGCGHAVDDDTGLTDLGRAVVRRMNELGMIVDLSHSGPQTALDTARTSDGPVIATHFGCRSVSVGGKSKHRNITDETMKVVADRGGLVGIVQAPNLLGGHGFEPFFRHLDYAVKLIGVDHVCIGSDMSPCGQWAEPAEIVERAKAAQRAWEYGPLRKQRQLEYEAHAMSWVNWPYWASVGLVCRGYSDEGIRRIIGENFIRVAGSILNKRLRGELI